MRTVSNTYKLEFATSEEHSRRGVIFVVSRDTRVTAKENFDKLNKNEERALRTRFDSWLDGIINYKWYHGWNQSEFNGKYTNCFVFKKSLHRFYGFLCHPKMSNPRYQTCILIRYDEKKGQKTNESNLKIVEEFRINTILQKIIKKYFTE